MIGPFSLAVLWLATASRLLRWRMDRRPWHGYLALAVAAGSTAATLHFIDAPTVTNVGRANLILLVTDICFIVASTGFVLYFETLSHANPQRHQIIKAVRSTGAAASIAMLILWTPVHNTISPNATVVRPNGYWLAFDGVFYGYITLCLIVMLRWCLRTLLSRRRTLTIAQRLSLAGMSVGLTAGVLVMALSILADIQHRLHPETNAAHINSQRNSVTYWGLLVLGLAVLALPMVPRLRRNVEIHRRIRTLQPLWHDLTVNSPRVPVPRSWPVSEYLELREQRMLVELHDALRVHYVEAPKHAGATVLAASLRRPRPAGLSPIPANMVLIPTDTAAGDREQMLTLARAYRGDQ